MVYGKPHTFIIVRLQGHRAWRVIGSQKSLRASSFSPYYFCGIVSACNQSDSFSSSFSMNVNCDLINPLINIPLLAVSSSETFLSQLEQIFMLREIITELFKKGSASQTKSHAINIFISRRGLDPSLFFFFHINLLYEK